MIKSGVLITPQFGLEVDGEGSWGVSESVSLVNSASKASMSLGGAGGAVAAEESSPTPTPCRCWKKDKRHTDR